MLLDRIICRFAILCVLTCQHRVSLVAAEYGSLCQCHCAEDTEAPTILLSVDDSCAQCTVDLCRSVFFKECRHVDDILTACINRTAVRFKISIFTFHFLFFGLAILALFLKHSKWRNTLVQNLKLPLELVEDPSLAADASSDFFVRKFKLSAQMPSPDNTVIEVRPDIQKSPRIEISKASDEDLPSKIEMKSLRLNLPPHISGAPSNHQKSRPRRPSRGGSKDCVSDETDYQKRTKSRQEILDDLPLSNNSHRPGYSSPTSLSSQNSRPPNRDIRFHGLPLATKSSQFFPKPPQSSPSPKQTLDPSPKHSPRQSPRPPSKLWLSQPVEVVATPSTANTRTSANQIHSDFGDDYNVSKDNSLKLYANSENSPKLSESSSTLPRIPHQGSGLSPMKSSLHSLRRNYILTGPPVASGPVQIGGDTFLSRPFGDGTPAYLSGLTRSSEGLSDTDYASNGKWTVRSSALVSSSTVGRGMRSKLSTKRSQHENVVLFKTDSENGRRHPGSEYAMLNSRTETIASQLSRLQETITIGSSNNETYNSEISSLRSSSLDYASDSKYSLSNLSSLQASVDSAGPALTSNKYSYGKLPSPTYRRGRTRTDKDEDRREMRLMHRLSQRLVTMKIDDFDLPSSSDDDDDSS